MLLFEIYNKFKVSLLFNEIIIKCNSLHLIWLLFILKFYKYIFCIDLLTFKVFNNCLKSSIVIYDKFKVSFLLSTIDKINDLYIF